MIKTKTDVLFELLGYCKLAVNGDTVQFTQEDYLEIPSEMIKIKERRNQTIESIKKQMPLTFHPYFKEFSSCKVNLANILLLSFYDYQASHLTQAKETILNTFHQYSLTRFPLFNFHEFGLEIERNEQHEKCSFTDTLASLDCNDEERFLILSAFMNFEVTVEKIFDFLEQMTSYLPALDVTNAIAYWQKESTMQELSSFLKKKGVQLKFRPDNFQVILAGYHPTLFSLEVHDGADTLATIKMGFIMNFQILNRLLSSAQTSANEKILKLLSDPSKYAILKMIKDKPSYGAEIAKAMQLKTSTISYHLNACIDASLVHVNRKENRCYFELNHEVMDDFIEALKNDFK